MPTRTAKVYGEDSPGYARKPRLEKYLQLVNGTSSTETQFKNVDAVINR